MYHVILDISGRHMWFDDYWYYIDNTLRKTWLTAKQQMRMATRVGLVDKCSPEERKVFYITEGPRMRALGLIK